MANRNPGPRLLLLFALTAVPGYAGEAAQSAPSAGTEAVPTPPLLVGVAVDEIGISQGDLQRSRDLILALLRSLPRGTEVTIASFSGDQRIILSSTSDESLVAPALATFKAGTSGVALPDGLFDLVQYLASREGVSRTLLLVSAGRVREGDLNFEDPLNAAISSDIRIFSLAVGTGDGKLLRRIAKLTGGEYVRLEVADVPMLTKAMAPTSPPAPLAGQEANSEPLPALKPEGSASTRLLGAAAIFFSLGGLLMLGLIVLLVRRLGTRAQKEPPFVVPARRAAPLPAASPLETAIPVEDETLLEKTLVANADPILRALSGPGAGRNFPLSTSGPTTIGRSRRNDIVVPEDAASAQHCRIDREGDSYVLHDLGSTNGAWLNGSRTERAVLQHGDRLKIGNTVFTVSLFGDRS